MTTYTHVFEVDFIHRSRFQTTTVDANDADQAATVIQMTRRDAEVHEIRDVTGHNGLKPLIWDD